MGRVISRLRSRLSGMRLGSEVMLCYKVVYEMSCVGGWVKGMAGGEN